jgi:hypothetical protein
MLCPVRNLYANTGASAASIRPQGIRFAKAASGCRGSIICSNRARKKSALSMPFSLDFSQVSGAFILISQETLQAKSS